MKDLHDAKLCPAIEADLNRAGDDPWKDASPSDEVIEDYLDHLCAPLVAVLPLAERRRLREEAAFHLERSANGYLVSGLEPGQAAQRAIADYGDSCDVSMRFVEAWEARRFKNRLSRRLGGAEMRALLWFGIANAWIAALLQLRIYLTDLLPNGRPVTFGLSPAQIRNIIPRPLPLPEDNPFFFLLVGSLLLCPIIAGWLTGSQVLARSARAVYHVQAGLTLYTFLVGMTMLPLHDGLLTAEFQLLYWLPVGCLSAYFASAVAWRRRCRYEAHR